MDQLGREAARIDRKLRRCAPCEGDGAELTAAKHQTAHELARRTLNALTTVLGGLGRSRLTGILLEILPPYQGQPQARLFGDGRERIVPCSPTLLPRLRVDGDGSPARAGLRVQVDLQASALVEVDSSAGALGPEALSSGRRARPRTGRGGGRRRRAPG